MKNLTNRPQRLALADLDGALQGFKKARELSQEECSCVGGGLRMTDDGDFGSGGGGGGGGNGSFSVSVSASGGTNDRGTSNFVGTVLAALFVFSLF